METPRAREVELKTFINYASLYRCNFLKEIKIVPFDSTLSEISNINEVPIISAGMQSGCYSLQLSQISTCAALKRGFIRHYFLHWLVSWSVSAQILQNFKATFEHK